MGSDLYNNLIRYFVVHLKGLREVSLRRSLRSGPLTGVMARKPMVYRMKTFYGTTLESGTDTRPVLITSTVFLPISIVIG